MHDGHHVDIQCTSDGSTLIGERAAKSDLLIGWLGNGSLHPLHEVLLLAVRYYLVKYLGSS